MITDDSSQMTTYLSIQSKHLGVEDRLRKFFIECLRQQGQKESAEEADRRYEDQNPEIVAILIAA